jgi:hypothetical protein
MRKDYIYDRIVVYMGFMIIYIFPEESADAVLSRPKHVANRQTKDIFCVMKPSSLLFVGTNMMQCFKIVQSKLRTTLS